MLTFTMIVHSLICIILVVVILMQAGRGGGLTESFASAESMFGAQTNEFMIKATTALSVVFLITCLGIAVLSAKKEQSLMAGKAPAAVASDVVADLQDAVESTMEGEESLPKVEEVIPEPAQ